MNQNFKLIIIVITLVSILANIFLFFNKFATGKKLKNIESKYISLKWEANKKVQYYLGSISVEYSTIETLIKNIEKSEKIYDTSSYVKSFNRNLKSLVKNTRLGRINNLIIFDEIKNRSITTNLYIDYYSKTSKLRSKLVNYVFKFKNVVFDPTQKDTNLIKNLKVHLQNLKNSIGSLHSSISPYTLSQDIFLKKYQDKITENHIFLTPY